MMQLVGTALVPTEHWKVKVRAAWALLDGGGYLSAAHWKRSAALEVINQLVVVSGVPVSVD